ncbi:MAG: hypothetical protein KKA56_16690 [Gammaproteobacteria bacterium]|nr:hypothetical protein [Gammaproteobacteria bacterium]
MRYLFLFLFLPFFVLAEINQPLQNLLLDMEKIDQDVRKELGQLGWDKAPQDLQDKLARIDESNTQKLKEILNGRAWFTENEVGKTGIVAAFLIIQHSPDFEFKEKMLPVLKKSYFNGEGITGQEIALLTDRILINKGEKQLYGTQVDIRSGAVIFEPISAPETVDERRAEMKMPPLEFYKKLMEEMYDIKDHPEIDLN